MDCSVIIATYNRARLLRQTLASLGTQVLPAGLDWEIVVVDNNSKDDTREVVDSCARQSGIPMGQPLCTVRTSPPMMPRSALGKLLSQSRTGSPPMSVR